MSSDNKILSSAAAHHSVGCDLGAIVPGAFIGQYRGSNSPSKTSFQLNMADAEAHMPLSLANINPTTQRPHKLAHHLPSQRLRQRAMVTGHIGGPVYKLMLELQTQPQIF